ncbi:dephospho-CoA kinase [Thermodesulfobacteriota bacterium]
MLIVGLTGGIASGKSTVAAKLRDAGVPVICLDELAHEVVRPGAPALEEIRQVFGDGVMAPDGGLDRQAMAQVVFVNREKRETLESIIHPRVAHEKDRQLKKLESEGHRCAVIDVPLLFEVGWEKHCNCVVLVYAPRGLQEERLMKRDDLSTAEARQRLDSQMSMEEKRERADYIIDNTGSRDETERQVEDLMWKLRLDLLSAKPES